MLRLILLVSLSARVFADCTPIEEITDSSEYEVWAFDAINCLSHSDPNIRDKIAFEGLSTILREKQISPDGVRRIHEALMHIALSEHTDPHGFKQPFVVLALAEIARYDRIDETLSETVRDALLVYAISYLTSINDYRGFDETEGWRHGVAHAADLLMQLALNPLLRPKQHMQIVDAVATQVAPDGAVFYIYGEPMRLARPVLFSALTGQVTSDQWQVWFEKLSDPAPLSSWQDAYTSQEGLAKVHNSRAFALALYANTSESDNPNLEPITQGSRALLRALN